MDPSKLQANKLTKNPLGVIGLFIVLVYGIAGLVMSTSGADLDQFERRLLVLFLVIFPMLVLGCFIWLVMRHHTKLYAPSDFQNDESFIQLTPEEQRRKIEEDIEEIQASSDISGGKPEADLRRSLVTAEDLVLRDLELEYGVQVNRQVRLAGVSMDGLFVKDGAGYGIEVKYFKGRVSKNRIADSLRQVESQLERLSWRRFNVILAIVIDDLEKYDPTKEDPYLGDLVSVFPFRVTMKFYGLKQLSEKYGRIKRDT